MSLEQDSWKEPPAEKAYFDYLYTLGPSSLWKPLKEKYRYYKQQSYNTPKLTSDISFIKKFPQVCAYLPWVEQIRAEKIDVPLIHEAIEAIYNDHEQFLGAGGWRVVKNKSVKTHLQELLLLKLYKLHSSGRVQGSLGNLVLGFFYTLNYYKTCNYQIRLFNEFLLGDDLQSLFVLILLRRKSRRVNKDLIISSHHITKFVHVLKGERSSPSSVASYSSECEEVMGEVKLLLIYPEIMEYINNNQVVLHEIMVYSLMLCVGMVDESEIQPESTSIDWNHFLTIYFKELSQSDQSYQQQFLARVARANLRMAQTLFKNEPTGSPGSEEAEEVPPREKFLEESFGWLIGVIEGIFLGDAETKEEWRNMYVNLQMLYEEGLSLGNRLVECLLKSQEYFAIYSKFQEKGENEK